MDCPLSTWPSITQYDDFSWADPLESLDRSFDNDPGTFLSNSQESKPLPPPANLVPDSETPARISHSEGGNLYRLRSSESLAAARWESINAVDLESVLDSAFPSQDVSATPSVESVYDLYSDGILNDVDVLMSESMSNGAEGSSGLLSHEDRQMNTSAMAPDMASLSSSQEDMRCENTVVDGDSPASIKAPQPLSNLVPAMVDCNTQCDILDNAGGHGVQMVQPYSYNPIHGDPCSFSQNLCQSPMDLKESMFPQQLQDIRPNTVMQWPNTTSTSAHSQVFDGEKVHHSPLHVMDSYPAIMEQQVRLADAARVELKRNRAQASRARRLAASHRRAKKYPLQKLIRMSSPNGARDRLDQNLASAPAMPRPPMHLVSQGQFAGGIQPLSQTILNPQVPGFLPVVLQSPHLSSNHELLPHSNPLPTGPYFCYQQTPVAPLEDNRGQSGGGVAHPMTDQDVQSMISTPSMAMSRSANCMPCLDAVVLEQLQKIVGKMDVDMRLCIRDALYRLADSSKLRQNRMDSASETSSSHSNEAMETNTNPIDRWIVNILFHKQPTSSQLNPRSHAQALTQAGDPFLESVPANSSSQQWNSCGSSVNLHEQPLHLLTGL